VFYHEDLDFYIDKRVRSYNYLEKAWSVIEEKILFYSGTHKNFLVTLNIDDDTIYSGFTSNYKTLWTCLERKNYNHQLEALENFTVEFNINFNFSRKIQKSFSQIKAYYYYNNNRIEDEGIIEINAVFTGKIEDYILFKAKLFAMSCKEVQYAINRNIFLKNIGHDMSTETDAEIEAISACSSILNIDFKDSLSFCIINKIIFPENKIHMIEINKRINEL
jgi:hypothetical protein